MEYNKENINFTNENYDNFPVIKNDNSMVDKTKIEMRQNVKRNLTLEYP